VVEGAQELVAQRSLLAERLAQAQEEVIAVRNRSAGDLPASLPAVPAHLLDGVIPLGGQTPRHVLEELLQAQSLGARATTEPALLDVGGA